MGECAKQLRGLVAALEAFTQTKPGTFTQQPPGFVAALEAFRQTKPGTFT